MAKASRLVSFPTAAALLLGTGCATQTRPYNNYQNEYCPPVQYDPQTQAYTPPSYVAPYDAALVQQNTEQSSGPTAAQVLLGVGAVAAILCAVTSCLSSPDTSSQPAGNDEAATRSAQAARERDAQRRRDNEMTMRMLDQQRRQKEAAPTP